MAADARAARVATSNATNPSFNQTFMTTRGFAEPAAYFMALGHQGDVGIAVGNETVYGYTYTVNRSFVEYFFGKQRTVKYWFVYSVY
jgi:hypothetical protein